MEVADSSDAEPRADAEETAQIASAQWLSEPKAAAAVRLRQLEAQGGLPQDVYRAAFVTGDHHQSRINVWLEQGGHVDARCAEQGDATLLMAAARLGRVGLARTLLYRHQADPNLADTKGATALTLAAGTGGGHHVIVAALLHAGAEVNTEDNSGYCALSHAAQAGSISIVKALLQAGAKGRKQAMATAVEQNHAAVTALLRGEVFPSTDDAMDVMDIEAKLGMSLDELILLQKRGAPLMEQLRATHASLTPEDQLCMSLDDVIALSSRQAPCCSSPPDTTRRPSKQRPITYLRRVYFTPPHFGWDRCRRCLRRGHDFVRCNSPIRCFACGQPGHRVVECPAALEKGVFVEDADLEPMEAVWEADAADDSNRTLEEMIGLASGNLDEWQRRAERGEHYRLGEEVEQDEDRHHEFKASATYVALDRYICAFANTKGGKLLLGVQDNGVVCGIPFDRSDRDEFNRRVDRVAQGMQPPLGAGKVSVDRIPVINGTAELYVLVVRVKRDTTDPHVHFTKKHQAWWRNNGGGEA